MKRALAGSLVEVPLALESLMELALEVEGLSVLDVEGLGWDLVGGPACA